MWSSPRHCHSLSLTDRKSLAWARTNRLQLPQVRRLPARLSRKKILDETDVVKPIAPEADGPLSSLSEAEREKAYAA